MEIITAAFFFLLKYTYCKYYVEHIAFKNEQIIKSISYYLKVWAMAHFVKTKTRNTIFPLKCVGETDVLHTAHCPLAIASQFSRVTMGRWPAVASWAPLCTRGFIFGASQYVRHVDCRYLARRRGSFAISARLDWKNFCLMRKLYVIASQVALVLRG